MLYLISPKNNLKIKVYLTKYGTYNVMFFVCARYIFYFKKVKHFSTMNKKAIQNELVYVTNDFGFYVIDL